MYSSQLRMLLNKYIFQIRTYLSKSTNYLPMALVALIFFGGLALITYYRRGGIVDSIYTSLYAPGLRDVGIYIQASHDLLDQKSPYDQSSLLFRSGSFGVLIFSFLDMNSTGFVIAQIANFLGFLLFGIVILHRNFRYRIILLFLSMVIYFSSFREVFSTGQISGIVMGLVAIGIKLQKAHHLSLRILAAVFFAIALDLKPNLLFPIIVATYIYTKKYRDFLFVPLSLAFGSLLVNIYVGAFLQFEWFQALQQITDPESNPTSTGTKVAWPIVVALFNLDAVPTLAPLMLYFILSIVLFFALYIKPSQGLWLLSFLIPLSYSYFHLYSFFPIAFLALAIAADRRMPYLLGISLAFSFFSGGNFGLLQSIVTLVFGTFFIASYVLSSHVVFVRRFVTKFFVAIIFSTIARFTLMKFFEPAPIIHILNINILAFIAVIIFSKNAAKKISLGDPARP